MSVEPQALERSVLEGKEREELAAIAEALGLKPTARAAKATLISQILKGAGIETADDKPRRSRGRAQAGNGNAATVPTALSPDGSYSPEPGGGGRDDVSGGALPEGVDGPGPAEESTPAGSSPAVASDGESASEGGGTQSSAEQQDPAEGSTQTLEASATASGEQERRGAADGGTPDQEARPEERSRGRQRGDGQREQGQGQQGDGRREQGQQGDGQREGQQGQGQREQGHGQQGQGQHGQQGQQGQGQQGQQGQGQQGQQGQGQQGQGPRDRDQGSRDQGAAGDPGNRRGRRRRGRDRDRDRNPESGNEAPYQGEPVDVDGLLDLRDEGYGFLRTTGYLAGPNDVYVSLSQVRRFALRKGDHLKGASRPAGSSEKYPALLRIDTVNGMTPDEARLRPRFEALTPLFPDEKLRLEVGDDSNNMTARIVDLISPIGKGQRGLIVSPPKAGKTTVMKQIARSIETNSPEVHLMVLLVDERPEEVTDMQRWVRGEVVASTFDRPSDEHTQVAELAIDRAKRLVEMGQDVVIILDGITRLARAYNLAAPASGRILSGGVDANALYPPKKFFGAARNIEEGGSLTILATALVETGSRMDEVIFEEFKGTGNMELRLDRKLAERRIYPSIDVEASSTRHEELLFERIQLQQVWKLRRVLSALEDGAGLELLMDKIRTTKSNDEFLAEIAKAPTSGGA